MNKNYLVLIFWLSFNLVQTTQAAAFFIDPTVDATIFDGPASPKDGSADFINNDDFVQALNNVIFESRGVIEYDISGIGVPVTDAHLSLTVNEDLGPFPFTLQFYSFAADGAVTVTDYDTGSLFHSISYNSSPTLTVDVTGVLQDLIAANESFAGFNLRKLEEDQGTEGEAFVAFKSLEFPTAARLHINEANNSTVPEPASLFLLGSGLLGSLSFRKKRKV